MRPRMLCIGWAPICRPACGWCSFGLPAGAGLWLLAEPLATLFFQHGSRVTDFDMDRVARVVECYALGVWAFCAVPVLIRGYYALGNQQIPLRIAMQTVAINLGFNLVLIWPWAEAGLALSTSLAAIFQAVVLVSGFSHLGVRLAWPEIRRTLGHAALATGAMLLAGLVVLALLPDEGNLAIKLARVVVPLLVSVAVFAAIGRWLRAEEFAFLGWGETGYGRWIWLTRRRLGGTNRRPGHRLPHSGFAVPFYPVACGAAAR